MSHDEREDNETQPPGTEVHKAISSHERHCFVVMPHGHTAEEVRWFRGWYEVVVRPGILECSYDPILASAEEQPGAINDEIRAHLAFDAMVIVDLGGTDPEDDPNPNVMYELGIRHALNLPLVMMAWKGQRLPFDVGNQRVIMESRDLIDLESNRKKLIAFIHAAAEGKYYRPMEAVARIATIEAAPLRFGADSLLGVLAKEIRDLRKTFTTSIQQRRLTPPRRVTASFVGELLKSKQVRRAVYYSYIAAGGDAKRWPQILKTRVSVEFASEVRGWTAEQWVQYVSARDTELAQDEVAASQQAQHEKSSASAETSELGLLDEDLVQKVKAVLPAQPWSTGAHIRVSEELAIPTEVVSRAIEELIRRGDFRPQVGEVIFDVPEASDKEPSSE